MGLWKNKKFSLAFIAFFQALGLVIYCSLVGLLFWKGETWIGPISYSSLGPILFLLLFVTSALVSALLVLGYPIILFWEKKQRPEALKLLIFTTTWLIFFMILLLLLLALA